MNTIFEISADDIALLGDEDLRSLVARLCEAELRNKGISTTCVTWGGNQNAKDGGLDVRVTLPPGVEIDGAIPRADSGFQVKAEDTPPSKIDSEMRPKGILRLSIQELARKSGAYILVSSHGSTSDISLQKRRNAMAEAIRDLPNPQALKLDFYDRKRLETWLRDHTGTTLWVREKIGKPLEGWLPFKAWSNEKEEDNTEYLLDEELRIKTPDRGPTPEVSATEGINSIRKILNIPGGVVRLVGLSGVGKTRLVQALFDSRVGEHSLDQNLAIYTNLTDGQIPQPVALARELIVTNKKAILVVDNCPAQLHGSLSAVCRAAGSLISLITIEYDIRDDQPEGTEVFVLEPASVNLTEKLIKRQFSQLSPVDAQRIANFSGGNARIAIALAARIGKDETVAHLSDEDLFGRLFHQRKQADEGLHLAAQALSLVYSFDGEDVSLSEKAELAPLGNLVRESPMEMYRHSADLYRRGLLQRRGQMCAVLPQAIANSLASTALQNMPPSQLEECFVSGGNRRLLKSFSRRLGYLSGNLQARSIVAHWLSPGGMLENLASLTEDEYQMFYNVAPVDPVATLSALEQGLPDLKKISARKRYLYVLRSLAYDSSLFERSVRLIVELSEVDGVDDEDKEERRIFASLFPIYFSGTHASIEQRLAVLRSLLKSSDTRKRSLALSGLKALLETVSFHPGGDFQFGSHRRDYGWWPRTGSDLKHWYTEAVKFAEELALSNNPTAGDARSILASKFRGLWGAAAMHDELDRVFRRISESEFWPEGWESIRQTIHYDSSGYEEETKARLFSLEVSLRPKDLVQKVRAIVLSSEMLFAGIDSSVDGTNGKNTWDQVEAVSLDLGKEAAESEQDLRILASELVSARKGQLWNFGRGLADTRKPLELWNRLISELSALPMERQNVAVLCGFLHELNKKNHTLANELLDDAVNNVTLSTSLPYLQISVPVDGKGVDRLMRSLESGRLKIYAYRCLSGGRVLDKVPLADFSKLLKRIAAEPDGLEIALEILYMRLYSAVAGNSSAEFIDLGCELLRKLTFIKRGYEEHKLETVAKKCLKGEPGASVVREICLKLKDAVSKLETYPFYHIELVHILFEEQPLAVLEALCGGDEADLELGIRILDQPGRRSTLSFDVIDDTDLLRWCDEKREIRYHAIARVINSLEPGRDSGPHLTGRAYKILEKAPDRVVVLKAFIARCELVDLIGPAESIDPKPGLLDKLSSYPDAALVQFINSEKIRLADLMEAQKRSANWMQGQMERQRKELGFE